MSVTIKNPEEITILATGGTIDKFYSVAGTMDIGEPAAKDLLDRVITDVRFDIRPLMARSDAGFNLGAAIAALNLLEPGVYISMSGRIFPAESVRKDRSRGIFEG